MAGLLRAICEEHGLPYHQDADGHWQRTEGCVLGMGKLGGQELNYSSDVDVLFAYTEEGNVFVDPPGKNRGAGRFSQIINSLIDSPKPLSLRSRASHRRAHYFVSIFACAPKETEAPSAAHSQGTKTIMLNGAKPGNG